MSNPAWSSELPILLNWESNDISFSFWLYFCNWVALRPWPDALKPEKGKLIEGETEIQRARMHLPCFKSMKDEYQEVSWSITVKLQACFSVVNYITTLLYLDLFYNIESVNNMKSCSLSYVSLLHFFCLTANARQAIYFRSKMPLFLWGQIQVFSGMKKLLQMN